MHLSWLVLDKRERHILIYLLTNQYQPNEVSDLVKSLISWLCIWTMSGALGSCSGRAKKNSHYLFQFFVFLTMLVLC